MTIEELIAELKPKVKWIYEEAHLPAVVMSTHPGKYAHQYDCFVDRASFDKLVTMPRLSFMQTVRWSEVYTRGGDPYTDVVGVWKIRQREIAELEDIVKGVEPCPTCDTVGNCPDCRPDKCPDVDGHICEKCDGSQN
jgi:hypothetical protein